MTRDLVANDRLTSLETDNAELRERLDWYRMIVFGDDLRFPLAWHLTRTQARLLAALLSPLEYMSVEALMIALYGHQVDDQPDDKILSVLVHHLRRKLMQHGIEIRAVRGGYYIPRPRRDELRRALRLVSSPPWEHVEAGRRPYRQPRSAERIAAQDRLAADA